MLTRRGLNKALAALGLSGSPLTACAYDPTGAKGRGSELNSEWLIDDHRLLFVLTGTEEEPSRPAIWDTRRNEGVQYVAPDRDKWQDVSASQDGDWLIGTVHEYDEVHRAWPLLRNCIGISRSINWRELLIRVVRMATPR